MKLVVLLCAVLFFCAFAEDEHVITLDATNLESVIREGNIVVEFYAPWCGFCKKLAPEWEKAAKILKDKNFNLRLAKYDANAEENKELAKSYKVKGYPTIQMFKNGALEDYEEYDGPRTAEGIVDTLMLAYAPVSKPITTEKEANEFMKGEIAVVGIFEKEGNDLTVFLETAEKLHPKRYPIGYTLNAKLIDLCTKNSKLCKGATVLAVTGEERKVTKFEGEITVDALADWIVEVTEPRLTELLQDSPRHMMKFRDRLKEPNPHFIVYYDNKAKDIAKLKETLIELDETNDDINVFLIDPIANGRAAKMLDMDNKDYPAVVISDHENGKKFHQRTPTIEDIKKYAEQWKLGNIRPEYKSEEPPKEDTGPVKVLVGKTFNDVIDSGKDVLVEFYAPWCGHCKKLAPTYDNLGQHFSDSEDVIIAKMDATANDIPDRRFKVKGYPTLKYVTSEGEILDYKGDRTLGDLIDFVNRNLENRSTSKEKDSKKEPEAKEDKTEPECQADGKEPGCQAQPKEEL